MSRRVARPLMSAIFISTGVNALRHPEQAVKTAEAAGLKDAEKLVRVHGVSNLVGGLALLTDKAPRLAALGLAVGLVPATYVAHPFWSASAEDRQAQQVHFLKNLGLLGGLLIAAADTGGRESLPHALGRVSRRAAKDAGKAQSRAAKKAGKVKGHAVERASHLQEQVGDLLPV